MRGLAAQGDRTGAWQQAKALEALMRHELGRDLDPAVQALMAEMARPSGGR
jgi:hypothetical protein